MELTPETKKQLEQYLFGEMIEIPESILSVEKVENAITIRETMFKLFTKGKIKENPEFYNYNINRLEELNEFKKKLIKEE